MIIYKLLKYLLFVYAASYFLTSSHNRQHAVEWTAASEEQETHYEAQSRGDSAGETQGATGESTGFC